MYMSKTGSGGKKKTTMRRHEEESLEENRLKMKPLVILIMIVLLDKGIINLFFSLSVYYMVRKTDLVCPRKSV